MKKTEYYFMLVDKNAYRPVARLLKRKGGLRSLWRLGDKLNNFF